MARIALEVCVDSPGGLAAALEGGADRIELCAALGLGGLTPAPGLIERAARARVPVMAMVRPRPGDFVWSEADLAAMETDIAAIRAAGLAGVVIGASRPNGALDEPALSRLMRAARGLSVTLHRAFDLVPDRGAALELAVRLGVARILTSGGAATASGGVAEIAETVAQSAGRVAIMPGAGITAANVGAILDRVAVHEVHASCAGSVAASEQAVRFGFASGAERQTDAARVRARRQALDRRAATKMPAARA